jgi:long-chain acyl-CoA synthetase
MAGEVPLTIYARRLEEIVSRFPDKVALSTKTPDGYRDLTYREFSRQAMGVALGLLGLGLKRRTRVAILSENRPEWVVAYLGVCLAGGVVVPLDSQISPAEWRTLLDDSESQLVFVSGSLWPKLREAVAGSLYTHHLICFDRLSDGMGEERLLASLIAAGHSLSPAPLLPESTLTDVMAIIYTSGTTGRPKGVVLTQENIVSEIVSVLGAIHADESDTLLCLLPLQHVLSSIINVLLPVYLGAQVNFVDTLKRSEILAALEEGRITVLATVPQFFYLFHRRIEEELAQKPHLVRWLFQWLRQLNRASLRALHLNLGKLFFTKIHSTFGSRLRLFVSGGSAFDPKVAQQFHDLGFTILQGYGLTETSGACSSTREDNNVIGSVGPPLPGVEIQIVEPDDTGVGEIAVRGRMVMKGYYKNPAGTAEVMRNGWFYSGDLGRLDAQGNLFITGRKKEVIVLPNGKNIYPDELEAHYGQCPYIQEIAIIGIADTGRAEQGEKLHAVIVPNFDCLKSEKIANVREAIRDELAKWSNQLPHHKRLMSYQIQAEPLPRTTTRKIKRLELKALEESRALREMAPAKAREAASMDEQALIQSVAGREVLCCLRETYHRNERIDLGMNLELDLGFDSMERVELMASLEQALDLKLPDDFGAEIYTVRDLIVRLQEQAGAALDSGAAERQTWSRILSAQAPAGDDEARVSFSGWWLTLFKYLLLSLLRLLFRILLRLEARGLENLPRHGTFLICPNHLSYLDPFVVIGVLPYEVFKRIFFVGYSVFFQTRIMKSLARLASIIPVDPDANLLRAMKMGACGLRQGRILCIFPEGGRSFDGDLQEFRKGAAILAKETGAPIVPVGIHGTYEVWRRESRRIRLHKVTVCFGPPLEAGSDSYQQDTDRLRDAVASLIHPS